MSENWKLQVSVKLPHGPDNYRDTLINLRAESSAELAEILAWVEGNAATIASAAQTIHAQGQVAATFSGGGTVNVQPDPVQHYQQAAAAAPQAVQSQPGWGSAPQGPPPQWAGQQQAPAQPSGPPAPACAHGAMVYKENKPGAQKTWKAWMCPAPKGPGQCEPQWLR